LKTNELIGNSQPFIQLETVDKKLNVEPVFSEP